MSSSHAIGEPAHDNDGGEGEESGEGAGTLRLTPPPDQDADARSPSPSSATPANKAREGDKFAVGEKVLAFHGQLPYEAKIVKVRHTDAGDAEYQVHYTGWKKTYDEWLGDGKLVEFTQKNWDRWARAKAEADKKKRTGPQAKRTKLEEKRDPGLPFPLLMAAKLRAQLVADWQNVTTHNQVLDLPANMPVVRVVQRFVSLQRRKGVEATGLEEFASDVFTCFNAAIGTLLLYKTERPQFLKIRKRALAKSKGAKADVYFEPDLTHIYGAEHLLRLFVKFPELLAEAGAGGPELERAQGWVTDFVRFLGGKLRDELFCTPYVPCGEWKFK